MTEQTDNGLQIKVSLACEDDPQSLWHDYMCVSDLLMVLQPRYLGSGSRRVVFDFGGEEINYHGDSSTGDANLMSPGLADRFHFSSDADHKYAKCFWTRCFVDNIDDDDRGLYGVDTAGATRRHAAFQGLGGTVELFSCF